MHFLDFLVFSKDSAHNQLYCALGSKFFHWSVLLLYWEAVGAVLHEFSDT